MYRVKPGCCFIGEEGRIYRAGSLVDSTKEQVAGQLFKLQPLKDYKRPRKINKPLGKYRTQIED